MERKRLIRIGLITAIISVFGIWGLNFLQGKNLLINDNSFIMLYDKVDGLMIARPVVISGFQVGTVIDIELSAEYPGKVAVEISVDGDINVPKNTVAKLFSADIMGSMSIQLLLGSAKAGAQSGDTLQSTVAPAMKDLVTSQIDPIKAKVENLIVRFDTVMHAIENTFDEQTQTHLKKSLASVANGLPAIMSDLKSVTGNIKAQNDEITNITTNFSNLSDSLAALELNQTVAKTDSVLHELNKTLAQINSGQGTVGELVYNDTLYYNLEAASKSLDELLTDLKKNPKRYVSVSAFDFGKKVFVVDPDEAKAEMEKNKKSKKKRSK